MSGVRISTSTVKMCQARFTVGCLTQLPVGVHIWREYSMTKRDKAMLVRMFIFIIKCILKEKHVSIARAGEFGVLENDLREWMNE